MATQTDWEKAGGNQRSMVEAGIGDIKEVQDNIPGGWEKIWVEDPWTGKWEQVHVPHAEAEKRHRQGLPPRPSYWGESETKEWRKKLREEKERILREQEAKRAWHLEQLRKMGF